jgi:hypothetical protein
MKPSLLLVAVTVLAVSCSDGGGDEQPPPLGRIDGPAQVDPEFRDDRTDTRSDSDG